MSVVADPYPDRRSEAVGFPLDVQNLKCTELKKLRGRLLAPHFHNVAFVFSFEVFRLVEFSDGGKKLHLQTLLEVVCGKYLEHHWIQLRLMFADGNSMLLYNSEDAVQLFWRSLIAPSL
jgi:hypothetical protein